MKKTLPLRRIKDFRTMVCNSKNRYAGNVFAMADDTAVAETFGSCKVPALLLTRENTCVPGNDNNVQQLLKQLSPETEMKVI
jgi:hypothetical protein